MKYNKQIIENKIVQLKQALIMESFIKETIEKFKHYKNVDKRFIEALKADGRFHAFIIKDTYSTTFVVYSNNNSDYRNREEFRVYLSHVMAKKTLTWGLIELELNRYNYETRLKEYIDKRENFDKELKEFKKLNDVIQNADFSCFDLYGVQREFEGILNFAGEK